MNWDADVTAVRVAHHVMGGCPTGRLTRRLRSDVRKDAQFMIILPAAGRISQTGCAIWMHDGQESYIALQIGPS